MMKYLLILMLSIALNATELTDKQQHFIGSVVISATASGIAKYYGSNVWESIAIGAAASLLVGVAKEAVDGKGYGTEDINDVYADTLGALTGSIIMSSISWRF